MKRIFESVRDFLCDRVNQELLEIADEEQAAIPGIQEKFIIHGVVDPAKYNGKLVVSVMIDEQRESDGTITENGYETDITVTFICSNDRYEELVKRSCFYAAALKKAMEKSPTFNRAFIGSGMENCRIYYDAGTVEKQMTAAEFSLTVLTNY